MIRISSVRLGFIVIISMFIATGCAGNIRELYEQSRDEAMAEAPQVGDNWLPDVVLALKWSMVDDLLGDALDQRLNKGDRGFEVPLALGASARIRPEWRIREARIRPASSCPTCASLKATFDGDIHWSAGPIEGTMPLSLGLGARVEILTVEKAQGFDIVADLRGLEFKLEGNPVIPRLKLDLDSRMAEFLRKRFEKDLPRVTLAEFGQEEAPILALRILPQESVLRVDALSSSPIHEPLESVPAFQGDWHASISQASLLALSRRASFEQEPLPYGIRPEPRDIRIEGDRFNLTLRLWKLEGRGWWRDYSVSGEIELEKNRIKLVPETPEVLDHSQGAGLADPLAALAGGFILSSIEKAATMAHPSRSSQNLGSKSWVVRIEDVVGDATSLQIEGSAQATNP